MLKETYSQLFVYLPGFASYLQTDSAQIKLKTLAKRIEAAKALDVVPEVTQSFQFADFPYAKTFAANTGLSVVPTRQYFIFTLCHLVADLRTLHLRPEPIIYTAEEQASIATALAELLAESGFTIDSSAGPHWIISSEKSWALRSTPYFLALGEDLLLKDIQGDDAVKMKKLQMEIQMLLNAHPVNQEREARGEPTANAMWVWGQSDEQSDAINTSFDLILGDDFFSHEFKDTKRTSLKDRGSTIKPRALLGSFEFLSANTDEESLLTVCEERIAPLLLANKNYDQCFLCLDGATWLELKSTWSWRFWQRS